MFWDRVTKKNCLVGYFGLRKKWIVLYTRGGQIFVHKYHNYLVTIDIKMNYGIHIIGYNAYSRTWKV